MINSRINNFSFPAGSPNLLLGDQKTTLGLEERIMKRAFFGAMALAVAWIGTAQGSDPVGIYARVDRVWMEPNEQTPERIKIWGAFSVAAGRGDTYLAPECGYLYFQIDPGHEKECRAEWADFKRVAGNGQIIAFGNRYGTKLTIRTVPLKAPRTVAADPQKIAHWIANLDSDQFAVREKATRELQKLGESAQPALRKALEEQPKPEARKRLERLTNADRPDPYPLGVGVMKVSQGKNLDGDYAPIQGLRQMPVAEAPGDGSLEAKGPITLVARNVVDRRHAQAHYQFEIEDAEGTKEVSPPIPAGDRETKWSPKMELKAGSHYAWRVRAVKDDWKGPVCRAVFIVKG
jgi:hypothetical protein